jgi:radical SAM protein with 4Fe4S-binding SPASM domain
MSDKKDKFTSEVGGMRMLREADVTTIDENGGLIDCDVPTRSNVGIYWYLTFRCNLRCKHCWIGCAPTADISGELTDEEVMAVADRIVTFHPGVVILTGGEPLLHRLLLPVLTKLAGNGIPVEIETNGTRIDDAFIQTVRGLAIAGVAPGINISLDGGRASDHDWLRGQGSFSRVLSSLDRLADAGLFFDIQCIINSVNADGVLQLFDICHDLPIRFLKFGVTSISGRAEKFADDLALSGGRYRLCPDKIIHGSRTHPHLSVLLKMPPATIPPKTLMLLQSLSNVSIVSGCKFPMFGILPAGEVTICAHTESSPHLRFGRLPEQPLTEMYNGSLFQSLCKPHIRTDFEGICNECRFLPTCRGSCRAEAFRTYGSFLAPHPLCQKLADENRFSRLYRIDRARHQETF